MSRNPAKPEKKYFPGSKCIAGNILCIGFFFDSGRCFYSMYRFFYRFRKMLLEAEIIDSVFYVCHLGYTYIIYFTLARTRRYQGSRWGVKTFNSCTLQNLAQVMPSSLSNLSVHFNLWDKKGHQEIQVHSACCFPPQLSCMWAQWKRNLHGNLLDTNRTARPRCEVQRGGQVLLVMPPWTSSNLKILIVYPILSNSIQVEYCTSFQNWISLHHLQKWHRSPCGTRMNS